jgi:hypothetical protein
VFVAIGGVPWVVTTDTMKTVVIGRDHANQPIWHPAYAKCAAEFGFLPDACDPGAPTQKGSVEHLVTFVKQHFLLGRSFRDDAHLAAEATDWLYRVNVERESDATEQTPAARLVEEQPKFGPLPAVAHAYGFFDTLKVSRASLVNLDTNRSSAPVRSSDSCSPCASPRAGLPSTRATPWWRPTRASSVATSAWSSLRMTSRSLPASRGRGW